MTGGNKKELHFVQGGACMEQKDGHDDLVLAACVLSRDDCTYGDYHSSYQLHHEHSAGAECLLPKRVERIRLGRCGRSNTCAVDQQACPLGSEDHFITSEGHRTDCTVARDHHHGHLGQPHEGSGGMGPTHYGQCRVPVSDSAWETFCVWSHDECNRANGTYVPPSLHENGVHCTCDRVFTGACVADQEQDHFTCAVGPSSCDEKTTYQDAFHLNFQKPKEVECRLCATPEYGFQHHNNPNAQHDGDNNGQLHDVDSTNLKPPAKPTKTPETTAPTTTTTISNIAASTNPSADDGPGSSNSGFIAGAFLAFFAVSLILTLMALKFFPSRMMRKRKQQLPQPPDNIWDQHSHYEMRIATSSERAVEVI